MHPLILRLAPLLLTAVLASCGDKRDDTGTTPEETGGGEDTGPIDADGDGVPAREDCDDADPEVGAATIWYADSDYDGYGDDALTELACHAPNRFVAVGGDCDDGDRTVYPGAWEWCDGVDDDCDGEVDEEPQNGDPYYSDADGDGYGGTDSVIMACEQPHGTIEDGSDCDDDDPSVHPGAEETCGDWVDNDCDGFVGDGCPFEGNTLATDADVVLRGVYSRTGTELESAGDVNGDGFDDLLVGCASVFHLVHGPIPRGTTTMDIAQAEFSLATEGTGAGDLNLDGYDDLLFKGLDRSAGTSAAVVVLGPVSGTVRLDPAESGQFLYGEDDDDVAGNSVSAAGDINGDGLPDVIVGAYREDTNGDDAGAAYVVMGPVTDAASLASGSVKLLGEAERDYAGNNVADAGDTNGDGLDDVLVGAFNESSIGEWGGAAYLVLGSEDFHAGQVSGLSSADAKIVAEELAYHTYLGSSPAGGGDVDADGYDDVVVGAPAFNTPNKAYIFYGPISGTISAATADGTIEGPATNVHLGSSLAMAGDVDGDGRSEILVGASYEDQGYRNGGEAYILFGPVSGSYTRETVDASWAGTFAGECVGYSVSGAGDLDGDGAADIAFSGSAVDDYDHHYGTYLHNGAVYVMYGLF